MKKIYLSFLCTLGNITLFAQNGGNSDALFDSVMIFIDGGTFQMGSPDGFDYEKPVHTVAVNSFYIRAPLIINFSYELIADTCYKLAHFNFLY